MKVALHAKVIDVIEQVVPWSQKVLVPQTIKIGAVHVCIEPVDMDIRFRGGIRVVPAAMMAAVRVSAVLRIVEPAIRTQHQSRRCFVHLLSKLDHPLSLRVDRVFSRQVPMLRPVAWPDRPKIGPVESSKVVLANQFNDLPKIGFGLGRELAQIGLPVGGHESPTEAGAKVVPPAGGDVVFISEIDPALG